MGGPLGLGGCWHFLRERGPSSDRSLNPASAPGLILAGLQPAPRAGLLGSSSFPGIWGWEPGWEFRGWSLSKEDSWG